MSPDLLDLMQESVVLCDRDGRIVEWNKASARLYGWSQQEAIGQPLHDLLGTQADARSTIEEKVRGRVIWEGEVTRRAANGNRLIVSLKCAPYGTDRSAETSIDISAQRRLEDSLARAEHRYYNVFQAMAVSFWELDFTAVGSMVERLRRARVDLRAHFAANPEFIRDMIRATRVIDVNDQSVRLFGRGNKEEMLNNLEPYWPQESYGIYAASVIAAVEGRPHFEAETRLSAIDGREFDVWFTACFPPQMLARGKLLIGVTDISVDKKAKTELELSELRYRSLFHFLPVAIVQLDRRPLARAFERLQAQGVRELLSYFAVHPEFFEFASHSISVVEANRRAVELFGAQDASQLLGPAARLWSEARETIQRSMAAAFAGRKRFESEMKIRTLGGEIREVLYVADFPNVVSETTIGLSCFVDISDRVKAQAMLAQVQAEFTRAARISLLGELTSSIAHEINQPLGAIANNCDAAVRWLGRPDPNLPEVLDLSRRSAADARRAADIIHRIRALAARRATAQVPTTLDGVIAEVMFLLGPELKRQGVAVTLALMSPSSEVLADRIQLQQVFANLVINAIQAMASGSERRLVVRTTRPSPEHVRVDIEDCGPGIPAQHLPQLFESFFTTKEDGVGIGLALCRSIIEAHGGRIEAANMSTGGARFSFILPAASP